MYDIKFTISNGALIQDDVLKRLVQKPNDVFNSSLNWNWNWITVPSGSAVIILKTMMTSLGHFSFVHCSLGTGWLGTNFIDMNSDD